MIKAKLSQQEDIALLTNEFKLKTNFAKVLQEIVNVLYKFDQEPLFVGKKPTTIHQNYPKYLCKFSLMKLQLNDYMFRETFVFQVLVFFDCLINPIKDQQNIFKLESNQIKVLEILKRKAAYFLR
jgi:hypothetical protein